MSKESKKICLVTGSRAEYGILKPLIDRLYHDSDIQLDIVATAMHMEEKYGYTYRTIEQDGYPIAKKIPIQLVDTTKETLIQSIATLQVEFAKWCSANTYDLLIILGDRYEMLAVANVALIYRIPVCHLHGGEKTLGNFDESIRHALTKMSHLHLVSAKEYYDRIVQMGENPKHVVHTGSLGVENVLTSEKLTLEQLQEQLGITLEPNYFVVLFHPVTLETDGKPIDQIKVLTSALEMIDAQYIFIGSNSDTGSDDIMREVNRFVGQSANSHVFASLTTQQYHSLVLHSKGLIGNSSSGLIEVPSLKKGTVNIGDRQKGRLRGDSVIDVPVDKNAIIQAIKQLETIDRYDNPYEKENASQTAYHAIKAYLSEDPTAEKDFFDVV
ncbi:UDP-N-acetylglucosamine 2-epimerase (hydrolyzing) [Carnobacteriaceae bacterium zg-ZUI240]|nr:UDP-N-acetylglucosamine 2-epimerase (hydrolyzing) [Carnobacteriaceae bacterium zg-ZUI240]